MPGARAAPSWLQVSGCGFWSGRRRRRAHQEMTLSESFGWRGWHLTDKIDPRVGWGVHFARLANARQRVPSRTSPLRPGSGGDPVNEKHDPSRAPAAPFVDTGIPTSRVHADIAAL